MRNLINKVVKQYTLSRNSRLENMRFNSVELQQQTLQKILFKSNKCKYTSKYGLQANDSLKRFQNKLPLVKYEDLEDDIYSMMHGERNVLCPGQVKWFSKSSGTSGSKSKFIPVTKQFMRTCYTRSNWDVVSILYNHNPEIGIFKHKNLLVGGSLSPFKEYPKTTIGDVSAIMMENMPSFAKYFHSPTIEVALNNDLDEKLKQMTEICSSESIKIFGGVPTWTLVLFKKMMEHKKAQNMLEIWPEVSVYIHGGVGFEPYRQEFKNLFPKDDFLYMEAYNASEGYFGLQDRLTEDGMLLLTDNSIFFEFLPISEIDSSNPIVLNLEEIEVDKEYALIISTSSGLWRYNIGDIVKFSTLNPYKFKVVGRTEQYINAFGEELMVYNTDEALAKTCALLNCVVSDYTVAPIYFGSNGRKPGHQWLIEFSKDPLNVEAFATVLDQEIQKLNSDYEAKRFNDLALQQLMINVLEPGSFSSWLKSNQRWGAQVKVPRLSNNRKIVEEILIQKGISI